MWHENQKLKHQEFGSYHRWYSQNLKNEKKNEITGKLGLAMPEDWRGALARGQRLQNDWSLSPANQAGITARAPALCAGPRVQEVAETSSFNFFDFRVST